MKNQKVQIRDAARGLFAGACRIVTSLFTAIVLIILTAGKPAFAAADTYKICENAAREAARTSGVPISVLRAISLTETGRKRGGAFRPWPWTVNMEGKGVWFDTEDEARAYVYENYKRGARSFDVGCFQLNYKWHGDAFASIEQMFDPTENASYAANFLNELFAELGNWPDAAGAYHSRTPKYANKYKTRFNRIRAGLEGDLPLPITATAPTTVAAADSSARDTSVPRINRFPLLLSGGFEKGRLGSLVPASAGFGMPRLIGNGS